MKQAKDFFRIVFHDLRDAVLITTAEGNVVYMNPAATELTGYFADDWNDMTSSQLFTEFAEETNLNTSDQYLQTLLTREDGSQHETELHLSEIVFSDERFVRHLLRKVDKTASSPEGMYHPEPSKQAKNDIHIDHAVSLLLMNLMENITDNIYFKDLDSRFILVNKAFCSWTGLNPDMVVGKSDFDLFDPAHAQKAYLDEQNIISSGKPLVGMVEKEVWPDGNITWVSTTKMPLKNAKGETIGTFGISRDVTVQKSMEDELRTARETAELAAVAKSAFLANMSHEIRTPLNAVVGMSDLLSDTPLNDEQKDYIETIKTSSETLLNIVNDILDLSKIEAGKLDLETVPFNLVQTIEKSVDVLAPKAAGKNLELMEYFKGSMPETVFGDPTRLRQVLLNLLSNSIKFTNKGEILVEVEGTPIENQHYQISFSISDTGIGMTKKEIERIFHPFEQADSSVTRKYGGTGLGLAICKKLVEMMHGEMTVQSEQNVGSEFKFHIVLQKVDEPAPAALQTNTTMLKNRRILVVDDNATNRKILNHELLKAQAIPLLFSSGSDVLDQLNALMPLDAAVLDYNMPHMDGCTLASELRKQPELDNIPILILSSSGQSRNGTCRCVDCWMNKPVKGRRLRETLVTLLEGSLRQDAHKNSITEPPPNDLSRQFPHRILLVEDNKVNQLVTLKLLGKLGYKADLAENGQEAILAVQEGSYDLILMDIQMPIMDGLEATRILREQTDNGRHPSIVGLSAHAMNDSVEEAMRVGMNGYLSKPVKIQDLIETIKAV